MFSKQLDFDYYFECLIDSELLHDILTFPELDQFDVGPEGSKLSGG